MDYNNIARGVKASCKFVPSPRLNMARQKKIKNVQKETKEEVIMQTTEIEPEVSQDLVLESLEQEISAKRQELEALKIDVENKKEEIKKLPAREIDAKEQAIVEKQMTFSNEKIAKMKDLERQKAYDKQMVTGRFMNLRNPGQPIKLAYIKYNDDPVKWYHFKHNSVYTIPRGFSDQINEYYHTPRFIQKEGEFIPSDEIGENSQIAQVDKSAKRYAFVPLSFAA